MPTLQPFPAIETKDSPPPAEARSAVIVRRDIKSLTALRFFSCFAFLFIHSREYFSCFKNVGDGFVFAHIVPFFFILSGFVLTLNYQSLNTIRGTLSFYVARFARMWPAHALTLLLLIALIPEIFKVTKANFPLFVSNICLLHSWVPSRQSFFSFNAPSWSNSTEIFFYLCFPLLLFGLRKRWYLVAAVAVAMLGIMIGVCQYMHLPEFDVTKPSMQGLIYIHPFSRLFEFVIGMLTALAFVKLAPRLNLGRATTTVLEVLILGAIFLANVTSPALRTVATPFIGDPAAYWLQNSGIAIPGIALLFLILSTEKGFLSKLLSAPFLVILGEISFGMYMLHVVLLAHRDINFPYANSLTDCILFLVTLMVAAHLMWQCFERPVRKGIMTAGAAILKRILPAKDGAERPPRGAETNGIRKKKLALLAAETLVLGVLLYATMPAVHPITPVEAQKLSAGATVHDVSFPPYLLLKSGSATRGANGTVDVRLVWESDQSGMVDFFVTLDVQDKSGANIGHLTYSQDLRRTSVSRGALWCEAIPVAAGGEPAAVTVKVDKSKRKVLRPSWHGLGAAKESSDRLTIPVN